jgi:hypothetical protein
VSDAVLQQPIDRRRHAVHICKQSQSCPVLTRSGEVGTRVDGLGNGGARRGTYNGRRGEEGGERSLRAKAHGHSEWLELGA